MQMADDILDELVIAVAKQRAHSDRIPDFRAVITSRMAGPVSRDSSNHYVAHLKCADHPDEIIRVVGMVNIVDFLERSDCSCKTSPVDRMSIEESESDEGEPSDKSDEGESSDEGEPSEKSDEGESSDASSEEGSDGDHGDDSIKNLEGVVGMCNALIEDLKMQASYINGKADHCARVAREAADAIEAGKDRLKMIADRGISMLTDVTDVTKTPAPTREDGARLKEAMDAAIADIGESFADTTVNANNKRLADKAVAKCNKERRRCNRHASSLKKAISSVSKTAEEHPKWKLMSNLEIFAATQENRRALSDLTPFLQRNGSAQAGGEASAAWKLAAQDTLEGGYESRFMKHVQSLCTSRIWVLIGKFANAGALAQLIESRIKMDPTLAEVRAFCVIDLDAHNQCAEVLRRLFSPEESPQLGRRAGMVAYAKERSGTPDAKYIHNKTLNQLMRSMLDDDRSPCYLLADILSNIAFKNAIPTPPIEGASWDGVARHLRGGGTHDSDDAFVADVCRASFAAVCRHLAATTPHLASCAYAPYISDLCTIRDPDAAMAEALCDKIHGGVRAPGFTVMTPEATASAAEHLKLLRGEDWMNTLGKQARKDAKAMPSTSLYAQVVLDCVHRRMKEGVPCHAAINLPAGIISGASGEAAPTSTPQHVEDCFMAAYNINHGGAPKLWSLVKPNDRAGLNASRQTADGGAEYVKYRCKLLSASWPENVKTFDVLQQPGVMVVTLAGDVPHQTTASGLCFAEASNAWTGANTPGTAASLLDRMKGDAGWLKGTDSYKDTIKVLIGSYKPELMKLKTAD